MTHARHGHPTTPHKAGLGAELIDGQPADAEEATVGAGGLHSEDVGACGYVVDAGEVDLAPLALGREVVRTDVGRKIGWFRMDAVDGRAEADAAIGSLDHD